MVLTIILFLSGAFFKHFHNPYPRKDVRDDRVIYLRPRPTLLQGFQDNVSRTWPRRTSNARLWLEVTYLIINSLVTGCVNTSSAYLDRIHPTVHPVPGMREAHVTMNSPVRVQFARLERPLDAPRQDVVVALALHDNRLGIGAVVRGSVDADAAGVVPPVGEIVGMSGWMRGFISSHFQLPLDLIITHLYCMAAMPFWRYRTTSPQVKPRLPEGSYTQCAKIPHISSYLRTRLNYVP